MWLASRPSAPLVISVPMRICRIAACSSGTRSSLKWLGTYILAPRVEGTGDHRPSRRIDKRRNPIAAGARSVDRRRGQAREALHQHRTRLHQRLGDRILGDGGKRSLAEAEADRRQEVEPHIALVGRRQALAFPGPDLRQNRRGGVEHRGDLLVQRAVGPGGGRDRAGMVEIERAPVGIDGEDVMALHHPLGRSLDQHTEQRLVGSARFGAVQFAQAAPGLERVAALELWRVGETAQQTAGLRLLTAGLKRRRLAEGGPGRCVEPLALPGPFGQGEIAEQGVVESSGLHGVGIPYEGRQNSRYSWRLETSRTRREEPWPTATAIRTPATSIRRGASSTA